MCQACIDRTIARLVANQTGMKGLIVCFVDSKDSIMVGQALSAGDKDMLEQMATCVVESVARIDESEIVDTLVQ